MSNSVRFPYVVRDQASGTISRMPFVPLDLTANGRSISALALLDTGATVNVLPYSVGEQLGFSWELQSVPLRLGGNLAQMEARAVAIEVVIATFTPVLLGFAWTRGNGSPIILGQMNFFDEFDVCFYRREDAFAVTR